MLYLDASTFIIALASENDLRIAKARELLAKVGDGQEDAMTASLTWDEVLWVVKKKKGKDVAKRAGKLFLQIPNLKIVNVTHETLAFALELFDKYDLGPRDSIHAACAIMNNAHIIVSEDSDFDRVKELKRQKLK